MKTSNNIVSFPKKNVNPDISLEDVQNNLNMMKHYHIQETIVTLVPII